MKTLPKGAYCIAEDVALVRPFVENGAAVVQLRLKQAGGQALLEAARAARRIAPFLIIDDRPDIARLAEADGVHLGQEDLPLADARKIVGPNVLIGLSTHSDAELDAASGADYVGFGPVFATGSKPGAPLPSPHGIEGLRRAVQRIALPVVAIGGITVATVRDVAAAGAWCAAAIAELAADPSRVRAFAEAFR